MTCQGRVFLEHQEDKDSVCDFIVQTGPPAVPPSSPLSVWRADLVLCTWSQPQSPSGVCDGEDGPSAMFLTHVCRCCLREPLVFLRLFRDNIILLA